MHYLTWRHGLKTGMTRLHTRTNRNPFDPEPDDGFDDTFSISSSSESVDSDSTTDESISIDSGDSELDDMPALGSRSDSTSSGVSSFWLEEEDDLVSFATHSDSPADTQLVDSNYAYRRSTSFSEFDEMMHDGAPDADVRESPASDIDY